MKCKKHTTPRPKIDPTACSGCGQCVQTCRRGAVQFGADGTAFLDSARCSGCGHCARTCPTGALRYPGAARQGSRSRQRRFHAHLGHRMLLLGHIRQNPDHK